MSSKKPSDKVKARIRFGHVVLGLLYHTGAPAINLFFWVQMLIGVVDVIPPQPKYVVDDNGNRVAVLLELDDYYALIKAWEQLAKILAEREKTINSEN